MVSALGPSRLGSLTWFCPFLRSPHTLRCLVSRWAWNPCPVSDRDTMSRHTEYSFRHTIHKARFSRCCSTPRVSVSFLSFLHSLLRRQPWRQPALALHARRSLRTLLSYEFPHSFSVRVIHPSDVLPHRWLSCFQLLGTRSVCPSTLTVIAWISVLCQAPLCCPLQPRWLADRGSSQPSSILLGECSFWKTHFLSFPLYLGWSSSHWPSTQNPSSLASASPIFPPILLQIPFCSHSEQSLWGLWKWFHVFKLLNLDCNRCLINSGRWMTVIRSDFRLLTYAKCCLNVLSNLV